MAPFSAEAQVNALSHTRCSPLPRRTSQKAVGGICGGAGVTAESESARLALSAHIIPLASCCAQPFTQPRHGAHTAQRRDAKQNKPATTGTAAEGELPAPPDYASSVTSSANGSSKLGRRRHPSFIGIRTTTTSQDTLALRELCSSEGRRDA